MRDDLIKKVKALADSGVGGEKTNAEALLRKLMVKYGLSEEDISSADSIEFTVKAPLKGYERKLFIQILHKCGYDPDGAFCLVAARKTEWVFKSSLSTKIDFLERWNFYKTHFIEDLDTFFLAFLYRNHLMLENNGNDQKPDEETLLKHRKALNMHVGLEQHKFHKAIEYRGKGV